MVDHHKNICSQNSFLGNLFIFLNEFTEKPKKPFWVNSKKASKLKTNFWVNSKKATKPKTNVWLNWKNYCDFYKSRLWLLKVTILKMQVSRQARDRYSCSPHTTSTAWNWLSCFSCLSKRRFILVELKPSEKIECTHTWLQEEEMWRRSVSRCHPRDWATGTLQLRCPHQSQSHWSQSWSPP